MASSEETVIELSKAKTTLLILGSVAFVATGIWMLTLDTSATESLDRYGSPLVIYGVGIAAIVFFGLAGAVGLKKLLDQAPGLVLDQEGFTDNSSGVSAGLVPWSEVVEIGESQVQRQKFISIHVVDPEKYVDRGNVLRRMTNRANLKMCGTPINISSSSLKISHEELLGVFETYFANRRDR